MLKYCKNKDNFNKILYLTTLNLTNFVLGKNNH